MHSDRYLRMNVDYEIIIDIDNGAIGTLHLEVKFELKFHFTFVKKKTRLFQDIFL